jgi:hypothetical protein
MCKWSEGGLFAQGSAARRVGQEYLQEKETGGLGFVFSHASEARHGAHGF